MEWIRHRWIRIPLILLMAVFVFTGGCGQTKKQPKKELLIYCGITMIKPMTDIAEIIEEQENCKIIIIKGGSGNLLKSIKTNKVGDLYLPGSDFYIKTCLREGLVTETVHVGHNKAAMMVQKGNPKGITADLNNLASKEYYVVICNPNSGSIGRETKKILDKKGIFQKVQDNARDITTDSKDLSLALINKQADIVINWYATSTWPANEPYVEVLPIDEKYAAKKKLVIGLLKTAEHPEIARKFMEYAASGKGHELFRKYGLYDVK
ncbi:MAG: substrate-binding domain-containing protein [Phycisphaerae bacterium]|nr:substrate-binding domain-containing protein [Phycisphaerae bacterium]